MREETYPFVMKQLPYDYNALIPILDAETLSYHHDKHYKTYVDNLNNILADYPELQKLSLIELLKQIKDLPIAAQNAVRNNGGGVYNHAFYFSIMKMTTNQEPEENLLTGIIRDFGAYSIVKDKLKEAALTKFGSGWAWLIADGNGKLSIIQTTNQEVPDLNQVTPILCIDVWEHAYYLQYKNKRIDYIENWFQLINWKKAEKIYKDAVLV